MSRARHSRGLQIWLSVLAIVILAWTVFPVYYMLLLSFTPTNDLFKPGLYVEHPTVRNYEQGVPMAARDTRIGGVSLGGIIVIVGIVLMFVWSFWIGLIIALIGLVAFGGFVRGKWY